jgi:hypothetical protein
MPGRRERTVLVAPASVVADGASPAR